MDKEFPGCGGSSETTNLFVVFVAKFLFLFFFFPGKLIFYGCICFLGVIVRLTHQFGGSKPLGWVLPCSESNLVNLPTFHNVTSECFVNAIVLFPLLVNVPVDFYTLEWKQSCNDLLEVWLQTFIRSPSGSAPGKISKLWEWSFARGCDHLSSCKFTVTSPAIVSGEVYYELFFSLLPKPR